MAEVIVDAMGEQCPIPVVKAARALRELAEPGTVEVLVDNEAAVQNLTRLGTSQGCVVQAEKRGEGAYSVRILVKDIPAAGAAPEAPQEAVCAPDARGGLVVAVSGGHMGQGDGELGAVLMKGFLFALGQLPELPRTVLFYNGGARLTVEGSDSLEDLRTLEAQGVEILTCGTCLSFYGLTEKLAVGGVTNMYSIVEKLAGASRVIRP